MAQPKGKRKGIKGRAWTDDEVALLLREWLNGIAMGRKRYRIAIDIAKRLGRTPTSVKSKANYENLTRDKGKLLQ